MNRYIIFIAVIVVALIVSSIAFHGCSNGKPSPPPVDPDSGLPLVQMQIGGQPFTLEVARTEDQMARGLMYRKNLPADRGMLFAYKTPRVLEFYMRNTHVPLDIIYLDPQGVIVSIHQMQPLDETPVASAGPAQYAIELNQGTRARLGLKPGQRLALPPAKP